MVILALWFLLTISCNHAAANYQLKIYIHDLPQWKNITAHGDISDSDYGLDQLFPELLKASPYVTTNPEEADYFFADAWIFWPHAINPLEDIIKAIRGQGPWFDRKNATDHIFVITADQGRCQYRVADTRHAIFLQHYGGSIHDSEFFTGPNSLHEKWGGDFDRLLVLSEAMRGKDQCNHPQLRCTEDKYGRKVPFFCNEPFQDIVVPPTVLERRPPRECHHCHGRNAHDAAYAFPYTSELGAELSAKRTITLLHLGATHMYQAEWYSLGSRQSMVQMFAGGRQPGFVLRSEDMTHNYWMSLLSSVFCLATTGTGWGSRFKVAVNRGCIPVIMMDGVKNEFEEQLPLKEYAIRIPSFMAFRTPEILKSFVDSGKVKQMQENLKCAWRLHFWRRPHGRAFEVVMCELKRRLMGLKGHIPVDFKACTITCGDEVIKLMEGST